MQFYLIRVRTLLILCWWYTDLIIVLSKKVKNTLYVLFECACYLISMRLYAHTYSRQKGLDTECHRIAVSHAFL